MRLEFFPTAAARPPNVVLVSSVVFTAESRIATEGGPLGQFPASIAKFRSLLAGAVVYVHTPVPDTRPARAEQQRIWIESLGGAHTDDLDSTVTHMVSQGADSKYGAAIRRKIPIVELSWVRTCFQLGTPPSHSLYPYRAGCLSGMRVSCFSLGSIDVEDISRLVTEAGGQWHHFPWRPEALKHLPIDSSIVVVPSQLGKGAQHHDDIVRNAQERVRRWAEQQGGDVQVMDLAELKDYIACHGMKPDSISDDFLAELQQSDAAYSAHRTRLLAAFSPATLASFIVQATCPCNPDEWFRVVRKLLHAIICCKIQLRKQSTSDQSELRQKLQRLEAEHAAFLDQEQIIYLAGLSETDRVPSAEELKARRKHVSQQWSKAVTDWAVRTHLLARRSPSASGAEGEPSGEAATESARAAHSPLPVDEAAESLDVSSSDDDEVEANDGSSNSASEAAAAPESTSVVKSVTPHDAVSTLLSALEDLFSSADAVLFKQRLDEVARFFHPVVWACVDKALGEPSRRFSDPSFDHALHVAVDKLTSGLSTKKLVTEDVQHGDVPGLLAERCFRSALQQLELDAKDAPTLQQRLTCLQKFVSDEVWVSVALRPSAAASRSDSSPSSVATVQPGAAAAVVSPSIAQEPEKQLIKPLDHVRWLQSNLVHRASDRYSSAFPAALMPGTPSCRSDPTAYTIGLVWVYDECAAEQRNEDQNLPSHAKAMPLLPYWKFSSTIVEPNPFVNAALLSDTFSGAPIQELADRLVNLERDPLLGRVMRTPFKSLSQDPRLLLEANLLNEHAIQSVLRAESRIICKAF